MLQKLLSVITPSFEILETYLYPFQNTISNCLQYFTNNNRCLSFKKEARVIQNLNEVAVLTEISP